jgi:flagellar hook assembly protein FlgD
VVAKNGTNGMSINPEVIEIVNCTIFDNDGYGIQCSTDTSYGNIRNCIIWGSYYGELLNCFATYSCIEDIELGQGNIHVNPIFIDDVNDDYHLWYSSPCIDTGDPNDDYSNEPLPNGGRINMGAYGNTEEATSQTDEDGDGIADGWELYYWPSDDPNQHDPNDDPDEDGFTNWIEYLFRYDPNSITITSMDVICYSGPSPQINPLDGEIAIIQYWLNKDANEVKVTITNSDSSAKILETIQTADAGIHYYVWDGIDANGLVVEPNCFDVTIFAAAASDPCDADTWTTSDSYLTTPSTNGTGQADASNFDPYKNIPARIDFDMSDWGKLELTIYCPDTTDYEMIKNRLLYPGHHTYYWDGRDGNGQIYEGEFTVYFGAPQGVRTSGVVIYYTAPEVNDLVCNQYRIAPTYREVTTISYNLTRNANVTMNIIDPDGSHFRTLLDNVFQNTEPNDVIWDGTDDDGNFTSTEGVYDLQIITEEPNYPEVNSGRLGAVTVSK